MKGITKEFVNKLFLVTIAAIIVFNLGKFDDIFLIAKKAFTPLFIGIIIAIIIRVPLIFFERKVFYKLKKMKYKISLWCAVLLFVGIIVGFVILILPKLINTVRDIVEIFKTSNPLEEMSSNNKFFEFVYTNLKTVSNNFIIKVKEYLPQMLKILENVFNVLINIFLGLFFAILILLNKEELSRKSKSLITKLIKREKVKDVFNMFQLALDKFSKFLGGQIIEAFLLGIVCYIFMLVLGLPYPLLIAAITAVSNLIPMLGAYIGGGISALLIFAVSPQQAIIFIIFIVILQQIESVTTYPIIVGKYVGLSGFWILTAVVLGGSLFGFVGVFLGVPIVAFLHDFIGGLLRNKKEKTSLCVDSLKDNVIK